MFAVWLCVCVSVWFFFLYQLAMTNLSQTNKKLNTQFLVFESHALMATFKEIVQHFGKLLLFNSWQSRTFPKTRGVTAAIHCCCYSVKIIVTWNIFWAVRRHHGSNCEIVISFWATGIFHDIQQWHDSLTVLSVHHAGFFWFFFAPWTSHEFDL